MKVEVIGRALAYTWPGGRVVLEPGKPIDLPDERAKKLMKRCPGRVRVVTAIQVGAIVEWDSPLFGILSGVALEVSPSGVTVFHPLSETECTIPMSWLRKEPR